MLNEKFQTAFDPFNFEVILKIEKSSAQAILVFQYCENNDILIQIMTIFYVCEDYMAKKYLDCIPKTLQEDFIDNRVIPFVGAGFSKNGLLTPPQKMPDWDELGRKVSEYIPDYIYTNAIDAFSIFESEFSRTKLIELLARELYIQQLRPGKAHRALCNTYFDTICTTNFDFLIEQTLSENNIPFSTIVSEDRLPINIHEKTKLIKLHGDFNHPDKMVITEYDYDTFVDRNKILTTFVSNLFITKTLLLVGYSLDDFDIRSLWSIIGSRLGRLSTPAYVILVDANPIEVSRFERRNIKVINIKGSKAKYSELLSDFFTEVNELIKEHAPKQIIYTNEKATEEQRIPIEDNRLCFVSAPATRISFLKELLYPVLLNNGIAPVSFDEAVMPGELITRKIDTLINQASMAIVDISGNNKYVSWELGNAIGKSKDIMIIRDEDYDQSDPIPYNIAHTISLKYSFHGDNTEFLKKVNEFFSNLLNRDNSKLFEIDEANRLLSKKEYAAAVILSFRNLEICMRKNLCDNEYSTTASLLSSLRSNDKKMVGLISQVRSFNKIRNELVHTKSDVDKKEATDIVTCVQALCNAIQRQEVFLDRIG